VKANFAEQAGGLTFANDEDRRYFVAFGKRWQETDSPEGFTADAFTLSKDIPLLHDEYYDATPVDEDFVDEYEDYCCLCGVHAVWEHDIAFNYLSNDDFNIYPAGPQHGDHAYIATGKRRCDDDKCGWVTNDKCVHRGKDLKCDVCGRTGHDKHACWTDKSYLNERVIKPNRVLTKAPHNAKPLLRDSRGFSKGLKPSRGKGKGKGKGKGFTKGTGRGGATQDPSFR
jgi:hypothetical protein